MRTILPVEVTNATVAPKAVVAVRAAASAAALVANAPEYPNFAAAQAAMVHLFDQAVLIAALFAIGHAT